MPLFQSTARAIRHARGLKSMDWLWNRLRAPYHFLLDPGSRGVLVLLGNVEPVRVPAQFTDQRWEHFERGAVERVAAWVLSHRNGCLLDIGSSVGPYALLATTISREARVIAFDGSLPSLKGLRLMCRHHSEARVTVVHGLISEHHTSGLTWDDAVSRTSTLLAAEKDPKSTALAYVQLTDSNANETPTHSLDGLIDARVLGNRPCLFKFDIEGAELLALRGAVRLLRTIAPTLIISVHPQLLPRYGDSKADVFEFLSAMGYSFELVEKDWEEHWWCTPTQPPMPAS